MQASSRLVSVISGMIIGGILYAAGAFLGTPRLPPAGAPGGPQVQDQAAGDDRALAALRYDLEQLRAELHAGRSAGAAPVRRPSDGAPGHLPPKLAAELHRLRAEVATLRTAVQQTEAMATPPAADSEEAAEPPPRTVADMDARTQAREQRDRDQRMALDTHVDTEGVDRPWSVATMDVITQVLASAALAATTVQDLECRTTVCRLTVEHEHRQALDQFALMFPLQVGAELPQLTYFHDQGTDGSIRTVIYLTRQGHSLPARAR